MGLQGVPAYASVLNHPVELDRNVLRAMFSRSGAARYGDFVVTPTGTTRQFSVSPGRAFALGVENAQQGGYVGWSDVAENMVVGAPSATPRIDTVLMRFYDSQYGTLPSGISRVQWDIIAGTPNASPVVLPDSSFLAAGANYVPGAWWRLCDIRSNPGDTTIPANQIYPTNTFVRMPGGTTLCFSVASTTGFGGRPSDPVLGDRIYEIDTGLYYSWNGTKWMRDEQIQYKLIDQLWTSNTVFADVTNFVYNLEANSKYAFDAFISYEADAAADLKIGLRAPASATARWQVAPSLASTSAAVNDSTFHAVSTSLTPAWVVGGMNTGVLVSTGFKGTITTVGTAGSFALQAAQNVSNAISTKIHADSWMKLRQVA